MAEAENPGRTSCPPSTPFTRPLRPGVRPLAQATWVCPVDGAISQFGAIAMDQIFQARGTVTPPPSVGGDATLAALLKMVASPRYTSVPRLTVSHARDGVLHHDLCAR